MPSRRYAPLSAGIVLGTLGVFVVDLLTPAGIEVWVLYLPVVLAPVFNRNSRHILAAGGACSFFVVVCGFISPPSDDPIWRDVLNRGMGVLAIGLTALTGVSLCWHSERLALSLTNLSREVEAHRRTEHSLSLSEERLRLAMWGGGLGTRDVDLRTGMEVWSETQFGILGYRPKPDGGATGEMWSSRTHPDDRKRVREAESRALTDHSLYHLEYRICRPNQPKTAWVEVFGRYHCDERGEAIRFVGVCFDVTARKDLEYDLLEVTARQQQEIGQELHDDVGQELTGLGLMAQSLTERLPRDTPDRGVVVRLVAGLDRVHQKVRDVSRGIMPVHLDANGLSAALTELAATVGEESGVAVTTKCPPEFDLPDNGTATQMYRIAQEAVTNAVRHGLPNEVRVTLAAFPYELRMQIRDDGIGVPNDSHAGDGLGLRIMKYRAGLIGGVLQVEGTPGSGTAVTLTLSRSSRDGEEKSG